jgi:hypothetical protein
VDETPQKINELMETVVLILMMMVVFSFVLKISCHSLLGAGAVSGVVALAVGLSWPLAIEQSQTQIADWLQDAPLMKDLSVVLTMDVAMNMAFCVLYARRTLHDRLPGSLRVALIVLRWMPGLLIFPTMFGVLVSAIFAFTGADFSGVAWSLAGIFLLASVGGSYGLKILLPEVESRLELTFFLNALTAVLGVIATVNGCTVVSA